MKRLLAFLAVSCAGYLGGLGNVAAFDLSDADRRYLYDHFGVNARTGVLARMTAEEHDRVRALLHDPVLDNNPGGREGLVYGALVRIYARECRSWAAQHGTPPCPPTDDAAVAPGKVIADRHCNSCHLFGTVDAPAFAKMAGGDGMTGVALTATLHEGHRMSPIRLAAPDLERLAAYIRYLSADTGPAAANP